MKVIVIQLIEDTLTEAVVAIPEGKTPVQVFEQWVAKDHADMILAENEDAAPLEQHAEQFTYEEIEVTTLAAGLPIEDTGATFADLIGDDDTE